MAKIEDTMTGTTTWELGYEIPGAGSKKITLPTKDLFVDKNIEITLSTAAGSLAADSASVSATDSYGILDTAQSSAPASGAYIKISGSGTVEVASAGWLESGVSATATADDVYYPLIVASFTEDGANVKSVTQGYVPANTIVGTIANGSQTITGGALSTTASATALASNGLSDGSVEDATKKIALSDTKAAGYYELEASGTATVSRAAVTKQVTSAGYFAEDATAQTAIAAGTESVVNTPSKYYVAQSTLSASQVTSSNVQQTVTIGAGYYHEARTVTVNPMASATVAPNVANTGMNTYFVAGSAGSNDVSLTPRYSVTSAGYVAEQTNTAGTPEYYSIITTSITEGTTTVSGTSATRGVASWNTGWITQGSISAASFANTATAGTTYVDISGTNDAPVLVSGDYLYINKGYVDDIKISLARLVPDGSDVKGHAEYILSGHSAYDNDGTLVAGTIQTYDGSYSIE